MKNIILIFYSLLSRVSSDTPYWTLSAIFCAEGKKTAFRC